MKIGDLNQRVEIQSQSETPSNNSLRDKITWSGGEDAVVRWANVKQTAAKEDENDIQQSGTIIYTVTFRKNTNITMDKRLIWEEKELYITSVIHDEEFTTVSANEKEG